MHLNLLVLLHKFKPRRTTFTKKTFISKYNLLKIDGNCWPVGATVKDRCFQTVVTGSKAERATMLTQKTAVTPVSRVRV